MDTIIQDIAEENKECCTIGCIRVGKIILNVRFLNKKGLFCDYCANDLTAIDLAVKVGNDSK